MKNGAISKLSIKGFKSIKELIGFEPGDLNVMIGQNGAGKSNFIHFFRFFSYMLNSDGKLQLHVAELGGASDVLHDGPDVTRNLGGEISIKTKFGINEYKFNLVFAKPDRLSFSEEAYRYSASPVDGEATWNHCGSGHNEARLPEMENNETASSILNLLRKVVVYQFYNTSDTAEIRLSYSSSDGRWLKQNAVNLGSFLYRLKNQEPGHYLKIVKLLRSVIPFFDDFELYEEFNKVLLRWKEQGTHKVFHAGLASDGMLRTIALISLLAQPAKDLPAVMFIDEPELGLHPTAVQVISSLVHEVSKYSQVFLSTQSPELLNYFEPEQIVVVNRNGRYSSFERLNAEELKEWLDEYSLSELWDKNVLGGKP